MLSMPPQNGKSLIVSGYGPAWVFGRNPDAKFVSASYAKELAETLNNNIQRIMTQPEYREVFPGSPIMDVNIRNTFHGTYARNATLFEIIGHKGRYFCAGRGGGISGQPMTFGNIDDLLSGRDEAESPTIRAKAWGWYNGDFYARQGKNAKILITATRWHEEDLTGKLLKLAEEDPDADQWTVLSFPAIATEPIAPYDPRKPGEALWPDRYPLSHLKKVRAQSEYDWQSVYQQNPHNLQFAIFNIDKVKELLVKPGEVDLSECAIYGAMDLSKGGNDYAALVTIAVLPDGRWLVWECDLSVDVQSKSISKLVESQQQYNYKTVWIEANSLEIAKSAWDKGQRSNFEIVLRQVQAASKVAVPYSLVWHNKPKPDRIRSLEAHFNNGQLCFREDWAKVYRELINQFRIFPDKDAHDDGPDAIEMLIEGITGKSSHVSLTIPTKPISRPYTRI
jgi:predicted phage terminase large subunit-like protein